MSDVKEVVAAWSNYLDTVPNWEVLIEGIEPKVGGCGLVYELNNPIDRPDESFAIADMRGLALSEPHRHANDETEIYFVLKGMGKIAVGDKVQDLHPGVTVITPPETMHVTLPAKDLILAVVNTPPFEFENYVVMPEDDPGVSEAIAKLRS